MTAVSETSICNSALTKIAEARISSIDDLNKPARTCKAQYPLMRDLLLEEYNWKFAITRVRLTPDGTDPAFGFSSRFLLPHDSLRFLGLYDQTENLVNYTTTKVSHKIEGRYLLLSDTSADIFYIKRVTDPTQFSPQFVECLALRLAIDICYDLTGGAKQVADLERRFDRQILKAQLTQAIQGQPEVIQASEWMDARYQDSPAPGNPWAFGGSGW